MRIHNSRRINWSKEVFQTREEARKAGNAYLAALEPIYQIARSIKVVREERTSNDYIYEIYLGDSPRPRP